jgi:hypothetical protein
MVYRSMRDDMYEIDNEKQINHECMLKNKNESVFICLSKHDIFYLSMNIVQ